MATVNFTVLNWAQRAIAIAAGLNPDELVVRHEDDRNITFLQHMPHREHMVSKVTGKIISE